MLEALSVLEGAKVIHCDLKPENLLLTPTSAEACGPNWDVHSLPPRAPPTATSTAAKTAGESNNSYNKDVDRADASNSRGADGHSASAEASSSSTSRSSPAHPAEPKLGLKVIDFGSACGAGEAMYSYIQSRFYRAPEVLLGLPYDGAIDMWSLGCIVAECFLGLPIFPGVSEHNQVCRIAEMLGPTPDVMLEAGKYTNKFYRRVNPPPTLQAASLATSGSLLPPEPKPEPSASSALSAAGMSAKSRLAAMQPTDNQWSSGPRLSRMPHVETEPGPPPPPTIVSSSSVPTATPAAAAAAPPLQPPPPPPSKFAMKTPAEYAADTRNAVPESKKYFKHSRLRDICVAYPYRRGLSPEQQARDRERRGALVHFLHQVLVLLPHQRLTPRQALAHPFVTGEPMPHVRDLWAAEQAKHAKEKRVGTATVAGDNATPAAAVAAGPVEANTSAVLPDAGAAVTTDHAASKAASLARLAKAVDADEDGYYWSPPDDGVLADRALRLLRHNQQRYDAQKKSNSHFAVASSTGQAPAATAVLKASSGLSSNTAPASAVVFSVPEVSLSGAVFAVAVPAKMCKRAVGEVVPMPTLPADVILILSVPGVVEPVPKITAVGTLPVDTLPSTS